MPESYLLQLAILEWKIRPNLALLIGRYSIDPVPPQLPERFHGVRLPTQPIDKLQDHWLSSR